MRPLKWLLSFGIFSAVTIGSSLALWGCGGGGGGGAAPTYSVSGTITGLTSSGLTLQLNGGNDLVVPANAMSFAFASMLGAGQNYAVTVSAQPSSPAQFCSVSNGSGTIGSASVTTVAITCATPQNVANITIDSFNGNSAGNTAYITIKVCAPGTNNCATIDHVSVDTGSFGLRLLSSAINTYNATLLSALPNVLTTGSLLAECGQFGSGYTWGSVRSVDFSVPNTNETVSGLPVQIVGDMEPAPSTCITQSVTGQMLGPNGYTSAANFGANGIIGVGPFPQDCEACSQTAMPTSNGTSYLVYTTCTSTTSSTCTASTATLAQQVINPVSDFTVDNTGVIISLPAESGVGTATASGTLTFGIVAGNSANNALGNAKVYLADPLSANVTTVYKSTTDTASFIDSGSNGLYFIDNSITACSAPAAGFYCPGGNTSPFNAGGSSTLTESATFEDYQGNNGTMVNFTIENLNLVTGWASSGLAGTGTANQFDWGMPFFFGRTVYTALTSQPFAAANVIGGNTAPFYAF
ncbi:MAG TPA: DUF3443 family protein [Steroidobacteraceae bacterium]